MRLSSVAVLTLALNVLFSSVAISCSCGSISLEDEYSGSDAVFLGKVISVEKKVGLIGRFFRRVYSIVSGDDVDMSMYDVVATLDVVKSWKGSKTSQVVVETSDPDVCCICGFDFREGETYLVLASGSPLGTGSCSRTNVAKHAVPEISQIELIAKTKIKASK